MRINHRIRSVDQLLAKFDRNSCCTPAITQFAGFEQKIKDMGFAWPLSVGESVLPAGHCGHSCSRNVNGWEETCEDRGLETFHYWQPWKWKMRRGYSFEYAERLVKRERTRRPKVLYPPFSMELQVLKRDDGAIVLAMPGILLQENEKAKLINSINVLVELFGTCFVLNESLRPIVPIRHAHWHLASQNRDWRKTAELLGPVFAELSPTRKELIQKYFESLNTLHPSLHATGQYGFTGLAVFGFRSYDIMLFIDAKNSVIFAVKGSWHTASQLTIAALYSPDSRVFSILPSPHWHTELLSQLDRLGFGI